jgi:hypothetical protein
LIQQRHCRRVLALGFLLLCGLTGTSFAQLPSDVVTSADPTAQRATIDAFVGTQVKKMLGADSSQWTLGRTLLIGEVAKANATPGFLDVYADSVNKALLPLTTNKDARIRLNAAIVAARIAAKAGNGRLAPVTRACLKDNSDAVVLWGLQSAKYVVPALLQMTDAKGADALAKDAIPAIENHMTAAVIEEGYRTLLLDPTLPVQDAHYLSNISPQMLSGFLPNPMALLEYRIKLYDEVDVPKQPLSDTWGAEFLVKDKVWNAQTPTQQGQSLNVMLGLLRGAAKQNAAVASPEMIDVIKRTGQGFHVVGNMMKKPALTTAADKVALITTTSAPEEITGAIDNLDAAVKALGLPAPTAKAP